jgi:hypothetical protein
MTILFGNVKSENKLTNQEIPCFMEPKAHYSVHCTMFILLPYYFEHWLQAGRLWGFIPDVWIFQLTSFQSHNSPGVRLTASPLPPTLLFRREGASTYQNPASLHG